MNKKNFILLGVIFISILLLISSVFYNKEYSDKEDIKWDGIHNYSVTIPYNLTNPDENLSKFCSEKGDIIYQEEFSEENNVFIESCISKENYRIKVENWNYFQLNITLNLNKNIKYLRNLETDEIYIVKDNKIDFLINPLGTIYLEYKNNSILCGKEICNLGIMDAYENKEIIILDRIPDWMNGSITNASISYTEYANSILEGIISGKIDMKYLAEKCDLRFYKGKGYCNYLVLSEKKFCKSGRTLRYGTDNPNIEQVVCV